MTDIIQADRTQIRAWLGQYASQLEAAQANGRLATYRLDLKDAFTQSIAAMPAAAQAQAVEIFKEEIEALCQDLRLATTTVQTQVERVNPPAKFGCGMAILCEIAVLAAAIFLPAILGIRNPDRGAIALGIIFLVGTVAVLAALVKSKFGK